MDIAEVNASVDVDGGDDKAEKKEEESAAKEEDFIFPDAVWEKILSYFPIEVHYQCLSQVCSKLRKKVFKSSIVLSGKYKIRDMMEQLVQNKDTVKEIMLHDFSDFDYPTVIDLLVMCSNVHTLKMTKMKVEEISFILRLLDSYKHLHAIYIKDCIFSFQPAELLEEIQVRNVCLRELSVERIAYPHECAAWDKFQDKMTSLIGHNRYRLNILRIVRDTEGLDLNCMFRTLRECDELRQLALCPVSEMEYQNISDPIWPSLERLELHVEKIEKNFELQSLLLRCVDIKELVLVCPGIPNTMEPFTTHLSKKPGVQAVCLIHEKHNKHKYQYQNEGAKSRSLRYVRIWDRKFSLKIKDFRNLSMSYKSVSVLSLDLRDTRISGSELELLVHMTSLRQLILKNLFVKVKPSTRDLMVQILKNFSSMFNTRWAYHLVLLKITSPFIPIFSLLRCLRRCFSLQYLSITGHPSALVGDSDMNFANGAHFNSLKTAKLFDAKNSFCNDCFVETIKDEPVYLDCDWDRILDLFAMRCSKLQNAHIDVGKINGFRFMETFAKYNSNLKQIYISEVVSAAHCISGTLTAATRDLKYLLMLTIKYKEEEESKERLDLDAICKHDKCLNYLRIYYDVCCDDHCIELKTKTAKLPLPCVEEILPPGTSRDRLCYILTTG